MSAKESHVFFFWRRATETAFEHLLFFISFFIFIFFLAKESAKETALDYIDGALAFFFCFQFFFCYYFLGEAKEAAERRATIEAAAKETVVDYFGAPLPHFTCFTGTKAQILTQKLEEQRTFSPRTPLASSLTKASRYSDFSVFLFFF
jgi:hypothetical protein